MELEFARIVGQHPQTICCVKNQVLGFGVPYLAGSESRRYLPDFVVRIDDGRGVDDPLNLVVEIKGERDTDDQVKAETMRVNNLETFGRWGFIELPTSMRWKRTMRPRWRVPAVGTIAQTTRKRYMTSYMVRRR